MKKKAAIELSVTAIIILILAIVILGLGLGFIRGMFTKVAVQFEEQIAAEPEPRPPTGSEPLTLSRESLIVHSGDPVALKVGIHNPSEDTWYGAIFNISCAGEPKMVTEHQFNSKDIDPGQSMRGTYLFVVGKVSEGTHLCLAKSQYNTTAIGGIRVDTNHTKDITIKISR